MKLWTNKLCTIFAFPNCCWIYEADNFLTRLPCFGCLINTTGFASPILQCIFGLVYNCSVRLGSPQDLDLPSGTQYLLEVKGQADSPRVGLISIPMLVGPSVIFTNWMRTFTVGGSRKILKKKKCQDIKISKSSFASLKTSVTFFKQSPLIGHFWGLLYSYACLHIFVP